MPRLTPLGWTLVLATVGLVIAGLITGGSRVFWIVALVLVMVFGFAPFSGPMSRGPRR